jgi:uncharacterized ParB-like nuclease family protein
MGLPAGFNCIPPEKIMPIHGVQDQAKYEALVEAMRLEGWEGRPLLVVYRQGGASYRYQALTGSHRLAAAREVGLKEIPAIVVKGAAAKVIKKSRFFPSFPPGITQELFEHNESWLGRFILMDQWLASFDREPWSDEAVEFYEKLGHYDMIDIMKVRKWPCRDSQGSNPRRQIG